MIDGHPLWTDGLMRPHQVQRRAGMKTCSASQGCAAGIGGVKRTSLVHASAGETR